MGISRAASIAVALVGCAALAGWILGVPILTRILPGLATMKVNTSAAFVLSGAALWVAVRRDQTGAWRAARLALGALVVLVGFLTLLEYASGVSFGIDDLPAADWQTPPALFPGRMSASTAIGFCLVGLALLLVEMELGGRARPAQWCALTALILASVALVGYLYGSRSLYSVGPFSSMALHTAVSFVLLSIGVLFARPYAGLMRIVSAPTGGGLVLRRSIPLAVLSLLLLGWLRLSGQRAGLFETTFGVAILVICASIVVSVIIWLNADQIHREEVKRQEALESLREADVKYSALVEEIPSAVTYLNAMNGGQPLYVSPQIQEVLGYSAEEWRDGHGLWAESIHPEDRPRALGARSAHAESGEPFDQTYRILSRQGRTVWVQDRAIVVRDREGRPRCSQGIMIDITQRKEAEETAARLNAELEEKVRLRTSQLESANKELEAFSYSVSHDLRAPLRAIDGFTRMLQEDYAARLDAEGQRFLAVVRKGTSQMGMLIDDLLAFSQSGRQPVEMKRVSPAAIARDALAGLDQDRKGRDVLIDVGELPECRADSRVLKQVFVNLLSNALKFTRARPAARIEVGFLPSETEREQVYYVKDNGVGFDMKYAGKLFGVFQRLHRAEEYEGTGVGLALVQRIIHRHGGRVWVDAEAGKGATFYFTLPAAEPAPGLRQAGEPASSPRQPVERRRSTIEERAVELV